MDTESKIVLPTEAKQAGPNHDQRRHMKKILGKMLLRSRAYVVVMWNGDEGEEPVAVIDIGILNQKKTITAMAFGKIAQHTAAVMEFCKEMLGKEKAQKETSDRAAAMREQRSAELAKYAKDNGEKNISD